MTKLYTKAQITAMGRGRAIALLGLMGRAQLASLAQQFGVKVEGERPQIVQAIIAVSHPLKPCGCVENRAMLQMMMNDLVGALAEQAQDEDPGQGGPVPGTGDR